MTLAQKAEKAAEKLKPGDFLLISTKTFIAIREEYRAKAGRAPRGPVLEGGLLIGSIRLHASSFLADDEMFGCSPVVFESANTREEIHL